MRTKTAQLIAQLEEITNELKSFKTYDEHKLFKTLIEIQEEFTGFFPVTSIHRDDVYHVVWKNEVDIKQMPDDKMREIRDAYRNTLSWSDDILEAVENVAPEFMEDYEDCPKCGSRVLSDSYYGIECNHCGYNEEEEEANEIG